MRKYLFMLFLFSPSLIQAQPVPVPRGGTGVTTLALNRLVMGNGVGPVQLVTLGMNGQVLTLVGGVPTWQNSGGGSGLVNWIDSINTAAPNNSKPAIALVVKPDSGSDIDAVIQARGTGATIAQIPDGTFAFGDKRGDYATDWQKDRADDGNAADVASGDWSTISGGGNNLADGDHSSVLAGGYNHAHGQYSIAGGDASYAVGDFSIALGNGNNANGIFNIIVGGAGLTLSGKNSWGYNAYGLGKSLTCASDSIFLIGGADIYLANASRSPKSLIFLGSNNSVTIDTSAIKYVAFRAPDVVTTSRTYTWPPADGSANQILKTNGSGVLSWTAAGGSGTVTSVDASGAHGITVSGNPITTSGTLAFDLSANGVALDRLATIADQRILGNVSGGTASVIALTSSQVSTMLGVSNYYTWSSTSSASFTAAVQNAYTTIRSGQQTVTLPGSPTDNQRVIVHGNNSGGWIISLSAQTIHFPGADYTTSVATTDGSVELIWNNTSSKWDVMNQSGTLTAN